MKNPKDRDDICGNENAMMICDKIKSWNEMDRPREKMLLRGPQSLSDSELLAILLGKGIRNKSALTLSKELLQLSDYNIDMLSKLHLNDLKKIKGVGDAKAVVISAALELGRRRQVGQSVNRSLSSSKEIFEYVGPRICDLDHEEFWVILLHKNLKIIDSKKMSSGGYDSVIMDVRMILKYALEYNAINIALVHNHPSGNITPSRADIEITRRIKDACRMVNITLVEHIIVGGYNSFFSFCDKDMI